MLHKNDLDIRMDQQKVQEQDMDESTETLLYYRKMVEKEDKKSTVHLLLTHFIIPPNCIHT